MILNNEQQSSLARCEIKKTVTVLNFKILEADLTADEFLSSAYTLLSNRIVQKVASDIESQKTFSVSDICNSQSAQTVREERPLFDCIKLVITENDDIICCPPSMDVQGLKEDRSYVVIGGSKGLGFNTVAWMASRGKVLKMGNYSGNVTDLHLLLKCNFSM